MLSLKSPRWLSRSVPGSGSEDSHELLGEDESSEPLVVARWRQSRYFTAFHFPFRNLRPKNFYTILVVGLATVILILLGPKLGSLSLHDNDPPQPHYPWQDFTRLDGYYNGISELVRAAEFVPQNAHALQGGSRNGTSKDLSASSIQKDSSDFELFAYQPHFRDPPSSEGGEISPRQQCFLRSDDTIPAPSIYAFDGVPQYGVAPLFGSYDVLNLRSDACFDRYGRYGPYGLGYAIKKGGVGLGLHGDQSLTKSVWATSGQLKWSSFDLGDAQRRCVERNQHRYASTLQSNHSNHAWSLAESEGVDWQHYRPASDNSSTLPRTAFVLRAWQGLEYKPAVKLYIRSLVNELSLQSGGEYEVHLLVEVKDLDRPIWTSRAAYDEVLAELVPEEFRSMATLWTEQLMETIYPGPFEPQFHNHGSMYPAMRSMHFALQWFMMQHPEYEYFWNWEMDIRYIGHWYELLNGVSAWAKKQPRDHLWARNARYYIPGLYDDWDAFARDTKEKQPIDINEKQEFKPNPMPGHEHDEEEEADFITFNPIFNPDNTEWNRREDVTGYDTSQPIPERRVAIVAASRHSRRLLLAMHHENFHNRHSMGSEMFPPTMALHHGLKAVYVPHPVYFERDWAPEYASEIFNGGPSGDSGNYPDSVFGVGPKGNYMALQQSTYYYEVQFPEFLWWRWLGYRDYRYRDEGGAKDELKKDKSGVRKGRMCLRSMLFHPVKNDEGRST